MKRILIFWALTVVFLNGCTFDECTSKSLYLVSFEQFIDKVKDDYKNYTDEDWEKADKRFKKLSGECFNKFKDKLDNEDKAKLIKFEAKYTYYRVFANSPFDLKEKDLNKIIDKLEEMTIKLEDIDGLLEKIAEDPDFRKSMKDFEAAFDRLGEGLERLGRVFDKFGKDLDRIFKDFEQDKD